MGSDQNGGAPARLGGNRVQVHDVWLSQQLGRDGQQQQAHKLVRREGTRGGERGHHERPGRAVQNLPREQPGLEPVGTKLPDM